jgi:hypothetical protein
MGKIQKNWKLAKCAQLDECKIATPHIFVAKMGKCAGKWKKWREDVPTHSIQTRPIWHFWTSNWGRGREIGKILFLIKLLFFYPRAF